MQKAIYIGAGEDIRPLICYPEIKNWIYVDSQPNNEFGPEYYQPFSRPEFINDVTNHFRMVGFNLKNNNNDILDFFNSTTKQRVIYCINIYIPDSIDKIKYYLKGWDTLIDSGHHPDISIMNLTRRNYPLTFIGFDGTHYGKDETPESKNTIVNNLFNNKYKFDNYSFNTTRCWWDLYTEMEENKRKRKNIKLLPGILERLDHNIIYQISQLYQINKVKGTSINYKTWQEFQENI